AEISGEPLGFQRMVAFFEARSTAAVWTPATPCKASVTCWAQLPQLIPPISSSVRFPRAAGAAAFVGCTEMVGSVDIVQIQNTHHAGVVESGEKGGVVESGSG